jgi:DNA primase
MHKISKELHPDTVSSSLSRRQLPKHNGPIDFARLRELVTMRQVLELLDWQHAARHGAQLRGPCPIHRSQNPQSRSLSVNIEKQVYRCFAMSCGSKGNQLDLFAAATDQPLYNAAVDLCERLGMEPPSAMTRNS